MDLRAIHHSLGLAQQADTAGTVQTRRVPLWPGREHPCLSILAPPPAPMQRRAAMVIFRGGAYRRVGSGAGCAEYFAKRGVVAVEAEYSTVESLDSSESGPVFPKPFRDGARAVRLVRRMAAELGVDPNRIGVVGFSAGGHLASLLCSGELPCQEHEEEDLTNVSFRPDVCILSYPVISMLPELRGSGNIGGTAENLGLQVDQEESLSGELLVTRRYPPTFIWHTRADEVVPVAHTERYADALEEKNVPHEVVLYDDGPHALGMAVEGEYANDWAFRMWNWLGVWAEARFCPPAMTLD